MLRFQFVEVLQNPLIVTSQGLCHLQLHLRILAGLAEFTSTDQSLFQLVNLLALFKNFLDFYFLKSPDLPLQSCICQSRFSLLLLHRLNLSTDEPTLSSGEQDANRNSDIDQ